MALILVIEDDPNTLQLMAYLLRAAGHTVASAANGNAGLDLARAQSPPDLVVCDIQLPGSDGFEIARALKNDPQMSRIPLVAVTALAMVGDREKILAGGFDGYLSKPITPETFVRDLETFLTPALRTPPAEGPDRSSLPTILIVDDHRTDREYLATLLRHRGYKYIEAADGTEAADLLRGTKVDLVVSDILMPTIDGYELVHHLRRTAGAEDLPVIFYTAYYNEREAKSLAEACGVSAVLTKPSSPEEVLRAIDDAVGRSVPATSTPSDFDERHLRVVNTKLLETAGDLQRKTSHLGALVEMNLQLASERDPQRLLSSFARSAREFVAARQTIVAAHDRDGGPLRHVYFSGMGPRDAARVEAALRRQETFTGLLSNPKPFRKRLDGDPRIAGLPAEHPRVQSLLVAAPPLARPCLRLGLRDRQGRDRRILGRRRAATGNVRRPSRPDLREREPVRRPAPASRRIDGGNQRKTSRRRRAPGEPRELSLPVREASAAHVGLQCTRPELSRGQRCGGYGLWLFP